MINIKNKIHSENKKDKNQVENKTNINNDQSEKSENKSKDKLRVASEQNKDDNDKIIDETKIIKFISILGYERAIIIAEIVNKLFLNSKIEILLAKNLRVLWDKDLTVLAQKEKTKKNTPKLLSKLDLIRKDLVLAWGVIIPGIRMISDPTLKLNTYVIKICGNEVAKGEVILGKFFAVGSPEIVNQLNGIFATDPLYGLLGVWIEESEVSQAEKLGCLVYDDATFIANHLLKVIENKIDIIFDTADYYSSLAVFEKTYFEHDFLKTVIPYKVLKNLLSEGISIKEIRDIISAIIVGANYTKDPEKLTEYVRINISHIISAAVATPDKIIYAAKLDYEIENQILARLERMEKEYFNFFYMYDISIHSDYKDKYDYYESYLGMLSEMLSSNIILKIEGSLREYLDYCFKKNLKPVIVTSLKIRRVFKDLLKIYFKDVNIFVISNFEIHPDYKIKFVSTITTLS